MRSRVQRCRTLKLTATLKSVRQEYKYTADDQSIICDFSVLTEDVFREIKTPLSDRLPI
jgi:hypothetical protein